MKDKPTNQDEREALSSPEAKGLRDAFTQAKIANLQKQLDELLPKQTTPTQTDDILNRPDISYLDDLERRGIN